MSTNTTTAPAPEQVRAYSSITAATMALGSKTYTGTVAGGDSGRPPSQGSASR